ncbi:hypothetical protein RFI_30138, partial [Reticulomyxa filosa]
MNKHKLTNTINNNKIPLLFYLMDYVTNFGYLERLHTLFYFSTLSLIHSDIQNCVWIKELFSLEELFKYNLLVSNSKIQEQFQQYIRMIVIKKEDTIGTKCVCFCCFGSIYIYIYRLICSRTNCSNPIDIRLSIRAIVATIQEQVTLSPELSHFFVCLKMKRMRTELYFLQFKTLLTVTSQERAVSSLANVFCCVWTRYRVSKTIRWIEIAFVACHCNHFEFRWRNFMESFKQRYGNERIVAR